LAVSDPLFRHRENGFGLPDKAKYQLLTTKYRKKSSPGGGPGLLFVSTAINDFRKESLMARLRGTSAARCSMAVDANNGILCFGAGFRL